MSDEEANELIAISERALEVRDEAVKIALLCYWLAKPQPRDEATGKPLHEVHEWLLCPEKLEKIE